ncbi:MAG: NYN domain-containing protein [Rhodobacteraceae bacterium]|nr:NYN domain-containing protein [Paracoccaceae bacterium]
MIDGGFFLKRLRDWPEIRRDDAESVVCAIRRLCQNHVRNLIGEDCELSHSRWLDHVYRLFFYDAEPFKGSPHHPLKNRQIVFAKTPEANFRRSLFDKIRKERKFALRLGSLKNEGAWTPFDRYMKGLMKIWHHSDYLESILDDPANIQPEKSEAALKALKLWGELKPDDVYFPLRQKGVDMKIGLDIASMTLKGQVDTIILVTGDSDFVPAAKVARREGAEIILDPMWWSVDDDLMEHIDGVFYGFDRPGKITGTKHD